MAKTTGTVSLVRGEDRIIPFSFRNASGSPLDLTDATVIVATFKTKSNGIASVTLADNKIEIVTPPGAGMVNVSLNSAFTTEMADGDRQDFQIDVVIAGKKTVFRFEESISVSESLLV